MLNLDGAYSRLDALMNEVPPSDLGFTQLLTPEPVLKSKSVAEGYLTRASLIRNFQQACVEIFRQSIAHSLEPEVLRVLLNDVPAGLGEAFHRQLEDCHWTVPQFFRTDETAPGRIVEIQCPGSLWGDYEALRTFYLENVNRRELAERSLAERFTQDVLILVGDREPTIHYLTDNASAPQGVRHFIASTRGELKYYGIDRGIAPLDCSLVRTHSFFGLMGENFALPRLEQCIEGKVTYDFPPHVLFDQKVGLALPFWEATAGHFSDAIRSILVPSYFVSKAGISRWPEDRISLTQFSSLPRQRRKYFLKYAGCDVSINWGSRAVYRLDNIGQEECLRRLEQAAADYENGRVWIVQPSEHCEEEVTFLTRHGEVDTQTMTAKYSGFYGPSGCYGVLAQYRNFYKVHGQSDTVASVVI